MLLSGRLASSSWAPGQGGDEVKEGLTSHRPPQGNDHASQYCLLLLKISLIYWQRLTILIFHFELKKQICKASGNTKWV